MTVAAVLTPPDFSIRYDDAVLREAARVFVVTSFLGRRGWLVAAALLLSVGSLMLGLLTSGWTGWTGFLAGVLVLVPLLLWLVYGTHLRRSRGKLGGMTRPEARVQLTEAGVTVAADSGSATIPWTAVRSRIEGRGVMLLVLESNQTITLPLRDVPAAAQAYLREKLPAFAG